MSAHNYTPTELGVFGISAEVQPEDTFAALRAILETVASVAQGIEADEMDRAQSIVEARMLRNLETMEGQANFIAEWQSAGDWRLGLKYLDTMMSLRSGDVAEVAARYLDRDKAAVLAYRPSGAPPIAASAGELRAKLAI